MFFLGYFFLGGHIWLCSRITSAFAFRDQTSTTACKLSILPACYTISLAAMLFLNYKFNCNWLLFVLVINWLLYLNFKNPAEIQFWSQFHTLKKITKNFYILRKIGFLFKNSEKQEGKNGHKIEHGLPSTSSLQI